MIANAVANREKLTLDDLKAQEKSLSHTGPVSDPVCLAQAFDVASEIQRLTYQLL